MSPVTRFYKNAIEHCHSVRQYNLILGMIRHAKAIPDDEYQALLKVKPFTGLDVFERARALIVRSRR